MVTQELVNLNSKIIQDFHKCLAHITQDTGEVSVDSAMVAAAVLTLGNLIMEGY